MQVKPREFRCASMIDTQLVAYIDVDRTMLGYCEASHKQRFKTERFIRRITKRYIFKKDNVAGQYMSSVY